MIKISQKGDFSKTISFLRNVERIDIRSILERYGQMGVEALKAATPKDTGKTSESWSYEVEVGESKSTIRWLNSNVVDGWANVAVLLQYGHGTGTGGYVEGRDYINPAMRPIFDEIAKAAFKEVSGQ